jgi:hypothetical protein
MVLIPMSTTVTAAIESQTLARPSIRIVVPRGGVWLCPSVSDVYVIGNVYTVIRYTVKR